MSDKVRLIDAGLLSTNIAQIAKNCARSDAQKALIGRILFMIENMVTIEAEPVKHGNWENDKFDIPRCSCCSYIPEFNRHIDDYYYSDFCPNCGARMDLKEGDGE